MFCKHLLALFLWCHCYQNVLDPFLLVSGSSIEKSDQRGVFKRHSSGYDDSGAPIRVDAEQVALTPGHEIALRCNITDYPDKQFSWFRIKKFPRGKQHPEFEEGRELLRANYDDKMVINNNVIILKSPTYADIGDYYCVVNNWEPSDRFEHETMIRVRAKPYILDFDLESSTYRSAVIEEGKSLKIPCNVVDDFEPNITISWHMSKFEENNMNDVIPGEDGIRIEVYNSTSQTLIIDRVTKDHRRFYKCRVSNQITDNSKVILIRVRDKYTVLWPTVGIVIELVILIGVICVVENRKVEPDKDTYDRKAIQM